MSETFQASITVRFHHVDAAGIVFYPRYYEMLNEVVERWFDEALGMRFSDLHSRMGCGVPARHIAVDFLKASRLGDVLTFSLQVAKLGQTSFELDIVLRHEGQERMRARLVLVYVTLSPFGTAPLPEAMRAPMASF